MILTVREAHRSIVSHFVVLSEAQLRKRFQREHRGKGKKWFLGGIKLAVTLLEHVIEHIES